MSSASKNIETQLIQLEEVFTTTWAWHHLINHMHSLVTYCNESTSIVGHWDKLYAQVDFTNVVEVVSVKPCSAGQALSPWKSITIPHVHCLGL